ncbi:MAG TPA: hypothetical protein VHG72_21825 [Polyangia bacterium]|nr:hypothetical protein [Polyangia bacterium]
MKRIGLLFGLVVLLASCEGCWHPAPTPVTPNKDASATADGSYTATCQGVCALGASLGCAFAAPTPAGASCVDVCLNFQAANITPWSLACRAAATSCAAIDACQ